MSVEITQDCGTGGCLYDIQADVTEHIDLAGQYPDRAANMSARLAELSKGFFTNKDKGVNRCPADVPKGMPCACYLGIH